MSTRTLKRHEAKRIDALIALPLARFRTAIARLDAEDLAALEARIVLQMVKQRWALGGHGIERHRAPNELALLGRRMDETRQEIAARAQAATQLHLVELEPALPVPDEAEIADRAA
ncbi:MAG: hypothetical protein IT338_19480 [Thermomicrobiales bacterium]|nr:hypothetical protein [Thermomicrobiales bacterium]